MDDSEWQVCLLKYIRLPSNRILLQQCVFERLNFMITTAFGNFDCLAPLHSQHNLTDLHFNMGHQIVASMHVKDFCWPQM